jgi:substrate import-associated zinc metallohydrolase lipoprotein
LKEYFHTVHHEYGHILNQMYKYDDAFKTISGGDYKADFNAYSLNAALGWGFVSQYAMSAHGEDFVEVLSIYLTSTQTEWEALLARAKKNNPEGESRIGRKIQIVEDYMKGNFQVNITVLRDHILKAIDAIANGDIEIQVESDKK